MRWGCSLLLALCWTAILKSTIFKALAQPEGSVKARLLDIPVYVISRTEARWHRTKEELASLHLVAERVHPAEPSLKQAQDVYAVHKYDKEANLSDVGTQRELWLVSAWDGLLRHLAIHPSMDAEDFACIFEDDIALHDDVSHAVARRALLHGMDLARKNGLLYLGSCGSMCWDQPSGWLQNVEFRKCDTPCSNAVCVTKRKSGTLMSEVKEAWEDDSEKYNYQSSEKGHCIDQMLRTYAEHGTSVWTVGTNLWSQQWVWYGDQLNGLFCRDKKLAHRDNCWPVVRPARGRLHRAVGAATPGGGMSQGQAGFFDRLT